MKLPFMADQFEQMLKISNEFVRLQVSHEEYLCMKVLLLLSTGLIPSTLPPRFLTPVLFNQHFLFCYGPNLEPA